MFPIIADNMISKPFIDTYPCMKYCCKAQDQKYYTIYYYSKHNVIPHLMCLYMSPLLNDKSKVTVFELNGYLYVIVTHYREFLIKASTNKKASHDLTWNFNFLSWIHNL